MANFRVPVLAAPSLQGTVTVYLLQYAEEVIVIILEWSRQVVRGAEQLRCACELTLF